MTVTTAGMPLPRHLPDAEGSPYDATRDRVHQFALAVLYEDDVDPDAVDPVDPRIDGHDHLVAAL